MDRGVASGKVLFNAAFCMSKNIAVWCVGFRPALNRVRSLGVVSGQGRFGDHAWGGSRHPWNVLVGRMAPELLHWLQCDEAFVPGTAAFQAWGLRFEGEGSGWRTEDGQKFVLSGWAGGRCSSRSMCGLAMRKPLPGRRLHAWFRAFRAVNKAGGKGQATAGVTVCLTVGFLGGPPGQHCLAPACSTGQ